MHREIGLDRSRACLSTLVRAFFSGTATTGSCLFVSRTCSTHLPPHLPLFFADSLTWLFLKHSAKYTSMTGTVWAYREHGMDSGLERMLSHHGVGGQFTLFEED
jgi:hypothetical protein